MSSKQICICLTHSFYSLHKARKWLCFCENEITIDYYHGSELKLRNTLFVAAAKNNGWLVDPSQWFPRCGWKPNNSGQGSKKLIAPRRSKSGLYIVNVTTRGVRRGGLGLKVPPSA